MLKDLLHNMKNIIDIYEGIFDKVNKDDVGKNLEQISNWGSVYKLTSVGGYNDRTASMLDIKKLQKLTDGMKPVNPEVAYGSFGEYKRDSERMRNFIIWLENLSFADMDFPDLDTQNGRREFTNKLNDILKDNGIINSRRAFVVVPSTAVTGTSQIQLQFLERNPKLYNSAIIIRFVKK